MRKLMKKTILGAAVFFMAFCAMPAVIPSAAGAAVEAEASEITPRADVIYWRYRTLSDGTIQKRRWNQTRGYWVDPYWINVN